MPPALAFASAASVPRVDGVAMNPPPGVASAATPNTARATTETAEPRIALRVTPHVDVGFICFPSRLMCRNRSSNRAYQITILEGRQRSENPFDGAPT